MRSIERYLLAWVLGALVIGGVLVAGVTYLVLLDELNEIYDTDLKHVAEALGSYRSGAVAADLEAGHRFAPRSDVPDAAEITTVIWTHDGRIVYSSDPRVHLPFRSTEALTRTQVGADEWIVYTDVSPNGVAQAAQRAGARQAIAAESLSKVFPPVLGLALLVAGLMVMALRRGLRPLDVAAREIANRSAESLAPVRSEGVPQEILPLVRAINGLLRKLFEALSSQRRFLADAAHELRTPVTALQLQVQLLRRSPDEGHRQEAMAELEVGIERSRRLVEQLLHVARFGPESQTPKWERVDLCDLVRAAVGSASAKADQCGIDLGAIGAAADGAITVRGDREQLTVLLNNLIGNALRYTPAGGVVDVDVASEGEQVRLRVIDNGPGIPPEERERVFDRFYRGADAQTLARDAGGSGLGLAIVRAIAEHHGAQVSPHVPASGHGLEVRVVFPRSPAP